MARKRKTKRLKVALTAMSIGLILTGSVTLVASSLERKSPPPVSEQVASYYASPPVIVERPLAIMFGDSYFNGWTDTPEHKALAKTTANHLGYDVWIRGIGATGYATERPPDLGTQAGSYVDQISAEPLTTKRPASFVLLQGGLADLAVPPEEFALAFRQVVDEVRRQQPAAQIYVLGPANVYPWEENDIVDNNKLQKQLCDELGVEFISIEALMPHQELLSYLMEDKTHPNQTGADLLSQRLADELVRRGVERNI